MKNGEVGIEAQKLEDRIYAKIKTTLQKNRGSKKVLSRYLGYAAQSSLSSALKERSFKLGTLLDIMYFLGLNPMQVFTEETRLNIEKLSLYDLVKKICGEMLEEHREQMLEIIENNNKGEK